MQITSKLKLSTVSLILSNLIPLLSVVFWQWNIGNILFLYWFENIVIGAYNIPRLLKIPLKPAPQP